MLVSTLARNRSCAISVTNASCIASLSQIMLVLTQEISLLAVKYVKSSSLSMGILRFTCEFIRDRNLSVVKCVRKVSHNVHTYCYIHGRTQVISLLVVKFAVRDLHNVRLCRNIFELTLVLNRSAVKFVIKVSLTVALSCSILTSTLEINLIPVTYAVRVSDSVLLL